MDATIKASTPERAEIRWSAIIFRPYLTIAVPVLLALLTIRLVMTPAFLAFEYRRPGFPDDIYGFTLAERLEYAPYTVDYLLNGEDITYLSDLRFPTGESMYTTRELRHMRDVKAVTQIAFLLASIMGITVSIIGYHLWRDSGKRRVLRRGLLDGSLLTLSIIATIIMVAIINWDQFFTAFHQVFFESGTWRFSYSDTLIRLFPEQFWFDAALTIGTLTSIGAGIILLITWRWNLTPGSADN